MRSANLPYGRGTPMIWIESGRYALISEARIALRRVPGSPLRKRPETTPLPSRQGRTAKGEPEGVSPLDRGSAGTETRRGYRSISTSKTHAPTTPATKEKKNPPMITKRPPELPRMSMTAAATSGTMRPTSGSDSVLINGMVFTSQRSSVERNAIASQFHLGVVGLRRKPFTSQGAWTSESRGSASARRRMDSARCAQGR